LSFFYFMPASPTINVVFHVGLGYYLAKADYKLEFTSGGSSVTDEYDTSGNGLGFHGGLGLEMALSPNMGIYAELAGRFASFGGFSGNEIDGGTTSGKLYYYEYNAGPTYGTIPMLLISNTLPSGYDISNAREASVSFTGFSAVAGLFFRF